MKCCNDNCRQGRDCPHRSKYELDLEEFKTLLYNNYGYAWMIGYLALMFFAGMEFFDE